MQSIHYSCSRGNRSLFISAFIQKKWKYKKKNVLFLRYWPRSSGQGRSGGNKAEARRVEDPVYGQVVFHRKEQRSREAAFPAFRDIASRAVV